MPLIKKVQNANPGNADLYGGNDLDTVSDYFNDVDTGNVPRINNPTEFRSGILKVRDSTNAYNVVVKSAAQTNSRDFTIPALAGNDSPATLALPNTFTAIQTVQSDNQRLLKMYRPVSTTNSTVGFEYQFNNSNNVQTTYAYALGKLITNTSGLEDGSWSVSVMKAGVMTKVLEIDKDGLLTVAAVSATPTAGGVTVLLNTGVTVTTASSSTEFTMLTYTVPGNTLGSNGLLRVSISGYVLQNQATATDFTFKIKFGGTIIYHATIPAKAQSAINSPFQLEFNIGNKNATNSQGMSGHIMMQDNGQTSLTVGEGEIDTDELISNGNFRAATGASAKDTTADQILLVTMQHSVNNANVATSVQRRMIELVPGV